MAETREQKEYERQRLRLLKLLSKYNPNGCRFGSFGEKCLITVGSKEYTFKMSLVDEQVKYGYVKNSRDKLTLTEVGIQKLKHLLNPDFSTSEHVISKRIRVNDVEQTALYNSAESPLSRLYFRKGRNGVPFISDDEFNAGERLRRDFEKGQLQPKITANLNTTLGGKGAADASNISDFAIDARARVHKALDYLGPELSSLTLDICCFLKGLESVERERKWPPRSAKLMLKAALSRLARHYGFGHTNHGVRQQTQFWGTSDYRPHIT